MAVFLMILLASLFVLVLTSLMVAGLERKEEKPAEIRPGQNNSLPQPRFFAGEAVGPSEASPYPLEALMSQIERHVRLEQAAAEAFLDVPTPESLYSRTASPFLGER